MISSLKSHLLKCLFPTVRLVTERTLELLSNSSVVEIAVAPLDVPLAHLLLQVLFEAGLVGKLSETVGAFERTVYSVMGSLEVIVKKSFLSEILIAILAYKRPFSCMNPVVNIKM